MCGIAGILGGHDVDSRRRRVERMTRALVHRGPDDEGFFNDDLVTLGFRRLAVIDLETGQQPIVDEERRLAILWLAAAASALALRPLWLAITPLLRPCVFRSITGFPCPSCGTTRAATAFLDGNLIAAFSANPLAAAGGLLFVVGAPLATLWAVARWSLPVLPTPLPMWVRIGAVALIAANWLYVITAP